MSRTNRSSTHSTARKRGPRIASRIVTAPTAPTPLPPEPKTPQPAPIPGHTLPPAPPRRATRMRISETNPWSVVVMSSLFLGGLGVCVLGGMLATSVILGILAPGEWPTPSDTLVIATGVVTLEVLLGTLMASLCSFMYNYTARFSGGVEVTLTDDLSDPTPAAEALRLMTRLPAGARRRPSTRLPANSSASEPLDHRRHRDSAQPAAEATHRPQRP
ncbi:DUF3566 domain-containing protein [Streptomyces sp. NPDC001480]|uniref:DUF3566 domain-containing protein n=1 Tax=Streptomyces sp. NPDC001480 TaxID=3364577 RepID=UPI0036AB0415